MRFAREHPGEFASLQARKLLLTFHDREIPDAWDLQFVAHYVSLLRWPLPRFGWIAPLAVLGVMIAWPLRRGAALLAWLALATAVSVSAFYVFARYRLPLAVFLLPFAGLALARGLEAGRGRRGRDLALGAAVLVPIWLLVHVDLARLGLAFTDEVGLRNLALLHLEEGHPDLAAQELERAVATNRDFADAWLAWARVERGRGDPAAARQVLERLLAHATARASEGREVLDAAQEASARNALGDLLRGEGDLTGALACFERAGALVPADPDPSIQAGITLRRMGRIAEARAAHAEALRRDPGNPVALVNLANVEEDGGDREAAIARLEEASASCAVRRPDLCAAIAGQRDRLLATLARPPASR
jgi:tetratricopeptide (TPR) repeat protein